MTGYPVDNRDMTTKIIKTQFAKNFRSGRVECWEAKTADGKYAFQRLEMPGTPWDVVNLEIGRSITFVGSLKKAQQLMDNPRLPEFEAYWIAEEDAERARIHESVKASWK